MAQFTFEDHPEVAPRIEWPEGKSFAFTIFDDPDYQTIKRAGVTYDFLRDHGFRTTKGVWPGHGTNPENEQYGATCADPEYLKWTLTLQERGFEIGWHGAQPVTSTREQTIEGFEKFHQLFGHWPATMSQHCDCSENIYWGDSRLTSPGHRMLYNLLTRGRNHGAFHGDVPGHPLYWSDICRDRVKYVRNFVFADMNTLAACPFMPYHDPARPDVNYWYASSEGHLIETFVKTISERSQDKLEAEGGACIMYTHFAYQFTKDGVLNRRFKELMQRLSRKNGWFVPVSELLDYILRKRGPTVFGASQRAALERRWLAHKIRFGVA